MPAFSTLHKNWLPSLTCSPSGRDSQAGKLRAYGSQLSSFYMVRHEGAEGGRNGHLRQLELHER